jgi:hypothetical protein
MALEGANAILAWRGKNKNTVAEMRHWVVLQAAAAQS